MFRMTVVLPTPPLSSPTIMTAGFDIEGSPRPRAAIWVCQTVHQNVSHDINIPSARPQTDDPKTDAGRAVSLWICCRGQRRRPHGPPSSGWSEPGFAAPRSEEHTSELQSLRHLVC